ncbi:MAG: hypothetical protein QW453_05170 [Thermoprotei archaeon]
MLVDVGAVLVVGTLLLIVDLVLVGQRVKGSPTIHMPTWIVIIVASVIPLKA